MGETVAVNKTALSALFSIYIFMTQQITEFFWIFLIMMLFDYATGLLQALMNHTWNSRVGSRGIIKKFIYISVVAFGYIVDYTILQLIHKVNVNFSFSMIGDISIGTLLMVFYIGNEFVSILENFERLGIKSPNWFKSIIRTIRNLPNIITKSFIDETTSLNKEAEKYESEDIKLTDTSKVSKKDEGDNNEKSNVNQQHTGKSGK